MKRWGVIIVVALSGSVFATLNTIPAPWAQGPSTTIQSWDFITEAIDPANVFPEQKRGLSGGGLEPLFFCI